MTIKVLPSKCEAYFVSKIGCLENLMFTASVPADLNSRVEIEKIHSLDRGNVDEVCAAIKEAVMMLTEG